MSDDRDDDQKDNPTDDLPPDDEPVKAEDDYKVGYGNPPKHTQFKSGQSGNEKGRPKGAKNASTIIHKILNEKVIIKEGTKSRKVSKLEAILQRTTNAAMQGDTRSINLVVKLAKELKQFEPETEKRTGGVLVVPAQLSMEEWMERYVKTDIDGTEYLNEDAFDDPG